MIFPQADGGVDPPLPLPPHCHYPLTTNTPPLQWYWGCSGSSNVAGGWWWWQQWGSGSNLLFIYLLLLLLARDRLQGREKVRRRPCHCGGHLGGVWPGTGQGARDRSATIAVAISLAGTGRGHVQPPPRRPEPFMGHRLPMPDP